MSYFKFKPGDRVRVIEHEDNHADIPLGSIGTVAEYSEIPFVLLEDDRLDGFYVEDLGDNCRCFNQDELELIEGGQNG